MTPAIEALKKRGVPHRVVSYEPDPGAASRGEAAAAALGVSPDVVFKTLVARLADGELVVAIVPASASLDLKKLAAAAGAKKAAMADPADAERATGYVVGGISPFAQKRRLRAFLDESAFAAEEVFVSAGRRGLQVALAPTDLASAAGARAADLAAQ